MDMKYDFDESRIRIEYASSIRKLEQEARLNRVGLWHDHNPIAPWKWRKPKTVVGNPN